jgi:hypothetical protein
VCSDENRDAFLDRGLRPLVDLDLRPAPLTPQHPAHRRSQHEVNRSNGGLGHVATLTYRPCRFLVVAPACLHWSRGQFPFLWRASRESEVAQVSQKVAPWARCTC